MRRRRVRGPGPQLHEAAVDVRLVRRQERTEVVVVDLPRALQVTTRWKMVSDGAVRTCNAKENVLLSRVWSRMVACHCLWVPEVDDDRELRLAVHRQPRERAVGEALECGQEREQNPITAP